LAHSGTEPDQRKSARSTCSRFACSCFLKQECSHETGAESEKLGALLLNIGAGGLCFESNFRPAEGAVMLFTIRPIEGPGLDAKVRVLHSRPSPAKGFYVIGSEFEELGEQERQNLLTLLHMVDRFEKDLAR